MTDTSRSEDQKPWDLEKPMQQPVQSSGHAVHGASGVNDTHNIHFM